MEVALANVLQQELRVFKELEKLTYDLERRPDYTLLSAFRAVDRMGDGRIDKVNLEVFFKNLNLYLSEREILALIRRIDTTADQTVTYEELQEYLEDQVGFRSNGTIISLAKGTEEVRRYIHESN
mmetsp:Transcript_15714/g.26498  ORF Transcript_15714/g.26498 Transcript_15714/m.26498 type:complete len:125 (-) Transcript_15714:379-753(-)